MGFALAKTSTLQVTPKTKMVNFQSMGVVAAKANLNIKELPAKHRVIANERVMFVKNVWELTQQGEKQADAVNLAAIKTELYPTLVKNGKHGNSTLTIFNFRHWKKMLGVKRNQPDFANLPALCNHYDLDKRGSNVDQRYWHWLKSFYLNTNRLKLSQSHRLAVEKCKQEGIEKIGTYKQAYYWLENYGDKIAIQTARMGQTWAEDHLFGYIDRDWTSVQSNEVWFGDHHKCDVFIKVLNTEKGKWEAVRPWLTAWMDAKTLRFVGVRIGVDAPSSTQILDALQNGIRNNNNTAPEKIYCDNGKDYLKQGFAKDFIPKGTEYTHSIVKEMGIKTTNSLPYRGRSKTIERVFKEVCLRFSKTCMAYTGSNQNERPEVSSFYHKNPETLPNLQQFSESFAKWMHYDYHATPSNGKILDGKSPHEAWIRGTGGMNFSNQHLWFSMLLPHVSSTPKVKKGCAVVLKKIEYRSDALWGYFGKNIMIKEDVVNNGAPHAFTLDGQHICELKSKPKVSAIVKTKDERDLLASEMKHQRRDIKRAYGIIDEETKGMHLIAPQELMLLKPGEIPEIKKIKGGKSVKGSTHNFVLHSTKPKELADEAPIRELTKGEEEAKQLQEFGEVTQKEETEPEVSNEEMAEFHKHVINKTNRNKNDNYTPEDDMWN